MFYPGWISKCARCLNAAKPKKTNVLTTYPSVFFPGDNRIFLLRHFCQLCVPSWVRLLRNDSTKNLLLHISLLRTKEKTQFKRPNSSAPFDVRKEHNYANIKHVLFIVIFTVCNVIVIMDFFFHFFFFLQKPLKHTQHTKVADGVIWLRRFHHFKNDCSPDILLSRDELRMKSSVFVWSPRLYLNSSTRFLLFTVHYTNICMYVNYSFLQYILGRFKWSVAHFGLFMRTVNATGCSFRVPNLRIPRAHFAIVCTHEIILCRVHVSFLTHALRPFGQTSYLKMQWRLVGF